MKEVLIHWAVNGKPTRLPQVQKLARKNKFSLDTPIEDMPARALNMILYGTAESAPEAVLEIDENETAQFEYRIRRIDSHVKKMVWCIQY